MLGNMMQEQLLISGVLEHAEKYNANTEIVSNTIEGGIHKYTIKDSALRSKKLANALLKLGIEEGDVIATMAVNSYRHLELYFGISGLGAVLHTLNPRLFPEDIKYIVNHAEDKYIFVDTPFLPIIENVYSDLKSVKGVIVLTDKNNMPNSSLDNLICYEDFISDESDEIVWPQFDENTASSLCYTSGTTGNPKGVLYSHRSTVLHAWYATAGNAMNVTSKTVLLLSLIHI